MAKQLRDGFFLLSVNAKHLRQVRENIWIHISKRYKMQCNSFYAHVCYSAEMCYKWQQCIFLVSTARLSDGGSFLGKPIGKASTYVIF